MALTASLQDTNCSSSAHCLSIKQPGMVAWLWQILHFQASFQALQISASLGIRIKDANHKKTCSAGKTDL